MKRRWCYLCLFITMVFGIAGCANEEEGKPKSILNDSNKVEIQQMNKVDGESVTADDITLVEVETAITEQGLELEEADLPSENAFIQELNGVLPKAYFISGKTLSIYVFSSEDEREKGMDDFKYKTAALKLVVHKIYTNKNVLVFYAEGNEETNSKLSMAINDLE